MAVMALCIGIYIYIKTCKNTAPFLYALTDLDIINVVLFCSQEIGTVSA